MRSDLVLPAVAVALLAAAPARAQEEAATLDIPVKIGQSVKDIRAPHFNADGTLAMRFNADTAERAAETKFDFHGLRIEIFKEDKTAPALEVLLSEATFDQSTSLLTSTSECMIRGRQIEITGRQMQFDVRNRTSKLLGPVTMTVENAGTATP
jgi:hypothetical protein